MKILEFLPGTAGTSCSLFVGAPDIITKTGRWYISGSSFTAPQPLFNCSTTFEKWAKKQEILPLGVCSVTGGYSSSGSFTGV